jgi:hypothetical protein
MSTWNRDGVVSTVESYEDSKKAPTPGSTVQVRKAAIWGLAGSTFLLSVYFLILTLSNSLAHALEELRIIGGWIGLMVMGFGIQTGLFSYIRSSVKNRAGVNTSASIAASGGMSTTAMVACCMHHITDLVPILGISAAALFLTQYQTAFLAAGVASNFVGVVMMLRVIQKNSLYDSDGGILRHLMKFNMSYGLIITALLGISLVLITVIRLI